MPRAARLLCALAIGLLFGCGRGSPGDSTVSAPGSPSPAGSSSEPLPARAQAVLSADALAVKGSRRGRGGNGAALEQAAVLRTRLFRREHREVDALEALELRRQVAESGGPSSCASELERLLLAGELSGDAEATYRELHALSRAASASCVPRIDAALSLLEAFRPSARDLPALEPAAAPAASGAVTRQRPSNEAPQNAAPTANLTHIERYSAKDAARVVVFLSRPLRFEVGKLDVPAGAGRRLFVDLSGASYTGPGSLGAEGILSQVRVAQNEQGTRVVLDLAGPAEHRVFYVPEPFRLVIDVAKRDERPSRDVRRVVLDPGHGGRDPGAIGPRGLREKDVALDIAHRAAPLIARELGISTLLTRDTDVFVPLEERTARANGFGADLFISIHCNAAESSAGSGVMTFVLDDSRDQLASRIAALENSASPEATSELARVLSRSGDRASAALSNEFAGLLQRAAMASLSPSYPDVPDGGVKRAGFFVLAGARMPAVLFETSFISSLRDETRFNTGDFRQKLADAIVNAVRAYREGRRSRPAEPKD